MEVLKQNRILILLISTIFICIGAFILLWSLQQGGKMGARAELSELSYTSSRWNMPPGSAVQKLKPAEQKWANSFPQNPDIVKFTASYGTNDPGKPAAAGQTVLSRANKQQAAALVSASQAASSSKASPEQTLQTSQLQPPVTLFFTRTALLSKDQKDKATRTYTVTKEDMLLLEKIVMAEAEGEPYEGKVAVANVVLNRLRSANYPDTIHDVIYEKHQFSPVANGRLKRVKPNEDTKQAVADAMKGRKEVSDDTYYFLSLKLATDLSVHYHKTKTKTIGNHTFYK
ncbi:cell wall hydrolase [Paenibacillus yonginensis]|uniref:cell wall hydrolase n=1 Tax=Paenibacillus yonginensis TaxID=1462996 RepID=UPI0008390BBC|nr:cell wall hydrolase [Paenibacillus yonginensis]